MCLVYRSDLTKPYPIKDQLKLLEKIRNIGKPVLVYLSKTDIHDRYADFESERTKIMRHQPIDDIDELKRSIRKEMHGS